MNNTEFAFQTENYAHTHTLTFIISFAKIYIHHKGSMSIDIAKKY